MIIVWVGRNVAADPETLRLARVEGTTLMAELVQGWVAEVERGPDWLFIRLSPPPEGLVDGADLADTLWSLVERHFTYRLLLECDELGLLDSTLVAQLLVLDPPIFPNQVPARIVAASQADQ